MPTLFVPIAANNAKPAEEIANATNPHINFLGRKAEGSIVAPKKQTNPASMLQASSWDRCIASSSI